MPYIGRAPSASITKLEDADQDTKIQVEESSDEDIIRFDIAGAEDFRMAANSFNVLSGSTLTIDSGATITNSGTANNFGTDPESAYAGVLQSNANFVDQVIFGPSVDGRAWNGLWNKASLFSSLMLATIEDEGSNTEINIWDLTEQSAGAISTTPLATVDLSAAATPTSIDACMGYLIVSSEDGIAIIDPHSGAWAERTVGWPKTLSTSTSPALSSNAVGGVAAGLANQPALDPRTGGPMPTFAVTYTSGSNYGSVIKDDGNVWDDAGSAGTGVNDCAIDNGRLYQVEYNGGTLEILWKSKPIETIVSDATYDKTGVLRNSTGAYTYGLELDKRVSIRNAKLATANTSGLTIGYVNTADESSYGDHINSLVNRTYNTGMFTAQTVGMWLANSKTADRSPYANTLTENGTVTEAVVETSAELKGYSGFTDTTNYLSRASDADWDVVGTGTLTASGWFKCTAVVSGAAQYMIAFANSGASVRFNVFVQSDGTLGGGDDGATAAVYIYSGGTVTDSVWHKFDFVRVSSTERYLYLDGILVASSTTDAGSISDSGNLPLAIGGFGGTGDASAQNCTLSLCRLSATAPTATQIRQMYDAEKGMFVASAECLLQSGSTDAVLDVNVDPLTNKVLVTQTDAITIFDGLVVDSKPTVNSGNSEKGKLWGALRAEQNSANAYVTAPAVDQRQVNEMVRGLAAGLPAGVDLSKAKAWIKFDGAGTAVINSSYNIKTFSDDGTGLYSITFGVPFKSANFVAVGMGSESRIITIKPDPTDGLGMGFQTEGNGSGAVDAGMVHVACFGELENE